MRRRGYSPALIAASVLLAVIGFGAAAAGIAGAIEPVIATLLALSALSRSAANALAAPAVDPIVYQWSSTPAASLKQASSILGCAVLVVIGVWQIRTATASSPADQSTLLIGIVTAVIGIGVLALLLRAELLTRRAREMAFQARGLLRDLHMWDGRHHWPTADAELLVLVLQANGLRDLSLWAQVRSVPGLAPTARDLGDRLAALDGGAGLLGLACTQQFMGWAARWGRPPLMI